MTPRRGMARIDPKVRRAAACPFKTLELFWRKADRSGVVGANEFVRRPTRVVGEKNARRPSELQTGVPATLHSCHLQIEVKITVTGGRQKEKTTQ